MARKRRVMIVIENLIHLSGRLLEMSMSPVELNGTPAVMLKADAVKKMGDDLHAWARMLAEDEILEESP